MEDIRVKLIHVASLVIFLSLSIIAILSILIIQKKCKLPTQRGKQKDRRRSDRRLMERRAECRAEEKKFDRRNDDRRDFAFDRRIKEGTIFDRENLLSIFSSGFSEQRS
jgi:hypothetical protein